MHHNNLSAFLDIRDASMRILPSLVKWRSDLNAIAEVGLELPNTSCYIDSELAKMELVAVKGYAGGYGLAVTIEGAGKGPTIAIRADMDGLPLQGGNGAKHLCGHDGHMAIALGVLKLLKEIRERLNGNVRVLFQPGEEWPGGARMMIEESALKGVDAALALHLDPSLSLGTIAFRAGQHNSFYDTFKVLYSGDGGHGAYPHQSVDPILASAYYVIALQQLVSRNVAPTEAAVVTVGIIHSGDAANTIPDMALLEGSMRCLSEDNRVLLHRRLKEIGEGVSLQSGVDFQLKITPGYPPVINDHDFTAKCAHTFIEIFPDDVIELKLPLMGSDDFSYIAREVPSLIYRLGCAMPQGESYPLHSPNFDFPKEALSLGCYSLSALCLMLLTGGLN